MARYYAYHAEIDDIDSIIAVIKTCANGMVKYIYVMEQFQERMWTPQHVYGPYKKDDRKVAHCGIYATEKEYRFRIVPIRKKEALVWVI